MKFRDVIDKGDDGTWERTIVESEVRSYVRARLPRIIFWGVLSLCKVKLGKNHKYTDIEIVTVIRGPLKKR